MKVGLGLYRHMLTEDNLRFAKQAGATHVVAHLVDYFSGGPRIPESTGRASGWGPTHRVGEPWTIDEIAGIQRKVTDAGLELHAIENFDPGHWYDVLLAGPRRDEQIAQLQDYLRILGELGIGRMGYNFSLAGVWGHRQGPFARGGAESIGFDAASLGRQPEIPCGQVWNMDYDEGAVGDPDGPTVGQVTADELWARIEYFLAAMLPVAEEVDVRLCAHPDDPPLPVLRNTARVLTSEAGLDRFVGLADSRHHAFDFCQGTVSEIPDIDIYELIARYAKADRIGYVHFRNVIGRVPDYHETFLDEGYVDMFRALRTYRDNGFDGMLMPDHTPQMTCAAPWHAGMAYALGWMNAAVRAVEEE
ncbi:TIM barrel protein [Nocardioides humilatus]|uniref:mannonate dehydratase n=1 Tax=Nocardioides humilatus TaxID=2607660 RepID=A0A5B1LQ39_9ACTN|nr:mannonate dehydratase [Nocardioides humilatus]KAA1421800.1 TIM barrel protein [Nocardioides humilatus]